MQNDRTLTETQIINKRWNSIKLTTGDAACGLVCAHVCVCDCDGHVFIYLYFSSHALKLWAETYCKWWSGLELNLSRTTSCKKRKNKQNNKITFIFFKIIIFLMPSFFFRYYSGDSTRTALCVKPVISSCTLFKSCGIAWPFAPYSITSSKVLLLLRHLQGWSLSKQCLEPGPSREVCVWFSASNETWLYNFMSMDKIAWTFSTRLGRFHSVRAAPKTQLDVVWKPKGKHKLTPDRNLGWTLV